MKLSLRRLMIPCAVLLAIAAILGVLTLGGLYQAAQHQEAWYRKALEQPPEDLAAKGDELEKRVFDFRNIIQRTQRWEAVFTDAQVNGWLAADLPEKFPDALPPDIQAPRVGFDKGQVRVACQMEQEGVGTMISLVLEVHLAENPNELAVTIRRARAGLLPLPLSQFLERIRTAAEDEGIPLRWAQDGGDPVAIVQIPTEFEESGGRIYQLESLELREGELYLAGRTQRTANSQLTAFVAPQLEGLLTAWLQSALLK